MSGQVSGWNLAACLCAQHAKNTAQHAPNQRTGARGYLTTSKPRFAILGHPGRWVYSTQLVNLTLFPNFPLDSGKAAVYKESMSESEARTAWRPNEAQLALLTVFQENGYGISVVQACTQAGVGRQTYYDWHDHPEFSQWWEAQANRFFRLQLNQVQSAAFDAATKKDSSGSDAARKLFFERFDRDYCPKSRGEVTGADGGPVHIQIIQFGELPRVDAAADVPPADTDGV